MDLALKVEELIKLTTSLKEELNELKGKDLNTKVTELEKEMTELKNDINELRYCLMKQNAKILALIHRLPTKKMSVHHSNECSEKMMVSTAYSMMDIQRKILDHSKIFPLTSFEDLDALDKSINDENIQEIIAALQQLITPNGIMKNIGFVLSRELIVDSNLDGHHKKKRLLNYTKFMDVLFQAAYADGYSLKAFLADMRRGLRIVKNRHFKNKLRTYPIKGHSHQGQDDEYACVSDSYQEEDEDDRYYPTDSIKIEDTSLYD